MATSPRRSLLPLPLAKTARLAASAGLFAQALAADAPGLGDAIERLGLVTPGKRLLAPQDRQRPAVRG
jgi:hypothetical protein